VDLLNAILENIIAPCDCTVTAMKQETKLCSQLPFLLRHTDAVETHC